MNRAALYVRCSKSEQTVENQELQLNRWAKGQHLRVVAVYRETASAWREGHQAELARLRRDAAKGRFDVVVIWALDRLSREGPLKVLGMVQSFGKLGVKIKSYQEAWTWQDGPMVELLYSITAWVAKYESERRSERTRAGIERARAHAPGGKLPARGKGKHKRKRRTPRAPVWESAL